MTDREVLESVEASSWERMRAACSVYEDALNAFEREPNDENAAAVDAAEALVAKVMP